MYPTIFDTEELTALRDLARKFASEKLAPGYQTREKAGGFSPDLLREMGGLGLIAPELPEEFGGLGSGSIYSGVIIEEIARGDFNIGYINILASLNGQILSKFANPELKREWLPKLIGGELIVAIALTEPRGGSDAANLGLRMERDGQHYVINGEKTSISCADQAKGAVVFARTGKPEDRAGEPLPNGLVDPPLVVQRDKLAEEIQKGRAFTRCDRLELPLIGIGRIEGNPEKQKACVIVSITGFGPADPADGAVDAQAHRFREAGPNGALFFLERAEFQIAVHPISPSKVAITASLQNRIGDNPPPSCATPRGRQPEPCRPTDRGARSSRAIQPHGSEQSGYRHLAAQGPERDET